MLYVFFLKYVQINASFMKIVGSRLKISQPKRKVKEMQVLASFYCREILRIMD